MAYWDARFCYGRKCLLDTSHLSVDDDLKSEILRLGGELVEAKASYRRACRWAWPYTNLRPLAKQPGLEPATIVNPFIPVPTVNRSPSSPDYKEIVAQLGYWEAAVCRCEKSLKDFFEKNNIPLPEAGARSGPGEKRNMLLRVEKGSTPSKHKNHEGVNVRLFWTARSIQRSWHISKGASSCFPKSKGTFSDTKGNHHV